MPGNPSLFGASVWGGPRQMTASLLNTSRQEKYVASRDWLLPVVPALVPTNLETATVSGAGAAGAAVSDGTWVATDSDGNQKLIVVKPAPMRTIVWLSAYVPQFDGSELRSVLLQDNDLVAASAGGLGSPVFWSEQADNSGNCELMGLPPGNLLLVRYRASVSNNLWFVSFDENGAHTISITLTKMPTEMALASNSSDITVTVGGEEVEVESVDAASGAVVLAAVPASVPLCTFWTISGDVFG